VLLEVDECSGQASTSKMTEIVDENSLIYEDRRPTIHELADTAGISYGVCQESLTENLNMRRILAKFVLQLLINNQK
jgi:hypothetical protein